MKTKSAHDMKNLKIFIPIFFLLSFFINQEAVAQAYTTAGGIRLGTEWGLTLQQRIAKRVTIEGILQKGITKDEFVVTALAERHYPLISKRLNFYTGAGLHKGWKTNDELSYENPFGITGIAGLEFTIGRLNLSYDFKPSLNISGGESPFYLHTGISLRYVLVKQKVFNNITKGNKKKKKQRQKAKRKKNNNSKDWQIWKNL